MNLRQVEPITCDSVTVAWDPPMENAARYRLNLAGTHDITDTTLTVVDQPPASLMECQVTAYDADDAILAQSETIAVATRVAPMGEITLASVTTDQADLNWQRPTGADNFLVQVDDVEYGQIQSHSPPSPAILLTGLPTGRKVRATITGTSNFPPIQPGESSSIELCTQLQAPTIQQGEQNSSNGVREARLNIQLFIPNPGASLLLYRDGELILTAPLGEAAGWVGTFADQGENCQGLQSGTYSYRAGLVNAVGAVSGLSNEVSVTVVGE